MLTLTRGFAAAPALPCTPALVAPAPPSYLIPPLLDINRQIWDLGVKNGSMTFKLNYDVTQFGPNYKKLTETLQSQMVTALGADSLWKNDEWITDTVQKAYLNYPAITPTLAAVGVPADVAQLIARYLLAPRAIFAAYAKVSAALRNTAYMAGTYYRNPEGKLVYAPLKDFVTEYRGLKRIKDGKVVEKAFLPAVVEGKVPLWVIPQPFGDTKNRWAVYIRWVSWRSFEIKVINVGHEDNGIVGVVIGALKWVANHVCGGAQNQKAYAAAVAAATLLPNPYTLGVLSAWTVTAAACGMPKPTQAEIDAAAAALCPAGGGGDGGAESEPTFWDLYQKPILYGGAGVLALLILKQVLARKQA